MTNPHEPKRLMRVRLTYENGDWDEVRVAASTLRQALRIAERDDSHLASHGRPISVRFTGYADDHRRL